MIYGILVMLFMHWLADFVFQTDEQAIGKSTNNALLTSHVRNYTIIMTIGLFIYGGIVSAPLKILAFIPITFVCHWVTDYYTSRLNAKLYKAGRRHDFFVSLGFDQFLHCLQLLLTFYFLIYVR